MDDGVNFLQEMIAYRSIGDATQTVSDRTGVPAPDGHDGLLRHLLFLRRREGVAPAAGSQQPARRRSQRPVPARPGTCARLASAERSA
jgi:hypothetical protein